MNKYKLILFTIVIICLNNYAHAQYQRSIRQAYGVNFEYITLDDGLSQSSVNVIFQDSFGFIWFGTQDGLNRYDGYNFTIYSPKIKDSTSISDNQIWAICEDSEQNLWIGTYGGLNKFDRKKEIFERFTFDENNYNSISDNQIRALYADNKNRLWIGTKDGLDLLDIKTLKFTHYKYNSEDTSSISGNYIRGFCSDNFNRIWVITDNAGANIFNENTNNFTRFSELDKLGIYDTRTIFCDANNNIWLGTNTNGLFKIKLTDEKKFILQKISKYPTNSVLSGIVDNEGIYWFSSVDGLIRYDSEIDEFVNYTVDIDNPKSLNDNYIWQVFEDRTGILWLGTYAGGICKFDKSRNKFAHYQIIASENDLIKSNFIRTFAKDKNNNLWVGSKGGLFKFVFNENKNIYEQVNYITKNKLLDNYIREIQCDSSGNLWIATNSKGIAYLNFNKKVPEFTFYQHLHDNENSLSSNNIRTLYIDKHQNLWIGTIDNGLNKLSYNNGKIIFEHFTKETNKGLTDNYIRTIFEDDKGIYWLGTENGGLVKFNYQTTEFTAFLHDENTNSISSNTVTNIHQDTNGNLWFGTYGGGLNLLKKNDEVFYSFNKENILPNNVIYGIIEDNTKNLWISTNYGLLKLDIENYNLTVYSVWDGLQSNEFNTGAFYKSADGEMFFGGINGFNTFFPENVKFNKYAPEIVITGFKVNNKSILPNDSTNIINKSILFVDTINLDYTQNLITIQFSALHFSNPQKNQYKYILEGIDKEWTIVSDKNEVTYSHLPSGKYTFIIKSSNCDGVWSKTSKKILINIEPPFKETFLFKSLIFIISILVVVLLFLLRTSILKRQKMELEKQVLLRTKEITEQKNKIVLFNQELELNHQEIKDQSIILQNHVKELSKLSLVASKTNNAIMILNKYADIEWVNEGFTLLYGLTYSDIVSRFGGNMMKLSVVKNISELIERCVCNKQVINYESYVNQLGINKIWVQTTLSPVVDEFGNVHKIIAIESDISELKEAEQEIMQKNEEIRSQKEALILQNEEINANKEQLENINQQLEIQNENIKGSIRTALTIQQSILPKEEDIQKIFDCFIFFEPKDIVSGDFYWFVHLDKKNELTQKTFLAVADCTGHGVPGAFMSMIGSRMLNEIVNQRNIFQPSQILETLNNEIIKALKQDKTDNTDGMDICLCYIEKQNDNNSILTFSGARRNLIYFNSNDKTIKIFKGDRKSIGGTFSRLKQNFTDKIVNLNIDDIIYLTSDGYTDQIGTNGHKFGPKQLEQILLKKSSENMQLQKQILVNTIKNWHSNEMQRDDITILGLKIK